MLGGLLFLIAGCLQKSERPAEDTPTQTQAVTPASSPPPEAVSLVISRRGSSVRTPPPSHAFALLDNPAGFSVHADRAVALQPVWQTDTSGQETTYTFWAPDSLAMRLRVTEGPVEEGMAGPSASAVFEVRSAPASPWTVRAVVPPGPLTEHMEPVPDVTGDGIPEVLRVESRVPCDGGNWVQVISVLPELRVLASLYSSGKGCER